MSSTNSQDTFLEIRETPSKTSSRKNIMKPERSPPLPPVNNNPVFRPISSSNEVRNEQTIPIDEKIVTQKIEVRQKTKNFSPLRLEFENLFDQFDYEATRNYILNRSLLDSNFATCLWRICLHCLPRDPFQWNEMLKASRAEYEVIYHRNRIDPYKQLQINQDSNDINHPLSQEQKSFWAQYFDAEELKRKIEMDVCRTCPDISFFRDQQIEKLQLSILYNHARHHQRSMNYRQGMHEILGVIVYCLSVEGDQVNECPDASDIMKNLYDRAYLEHDAYSIFQNVMNHMHRFYLGDGSNGESKNSNNDMERCHQSSKSNGNSSTMHKSTYMENLFKRFANYNVLLYYRLKQWKIEPQVYATRWFRLLFLREIPFESIPSLWTLIFFYDEHFSFVETLFLSLLIKLGNLFDAQEITEHNQCLYLLMQQNFIDDAESIIRHALGLLGREYSNTNVATLPIRKLHLPPKVENIEQKETETQTETKTPSFQRVAVAGSPSSKISRPKLMNRQTEHDRNEQSNSYPQLSNSTVDENSTKKSSKHFNRSDSGISVREEKTIREQFQANRQVQQTCANYMYRFIEHLEKLSCELEAHNQHQLLSHIATLKTISFSLKDERFQGSEAVNKLFNNITDGKSS